MESTDKELRLRPFRDDDSEKLAALINNKRIWDMLRDSVPFPYGRKDAVEYIECCKNEKPQLTFALEYKGEFVGGVCLVKQTDVYRLTAEIGYWVGEPYWGMGIATKAVQLITEYGFDQLGLVRIYAAVFRFNKASQKVLEKAGYKQECIFEKSVFKNDKISDEYRYACLNENISHQAL